MPRNLLDELVWHMQRQTSDPISNKEDGTNKCLRLSSDHTTHALLLTRAHIHSHNMFTHEHTIYHHNNSPTRPVAWIISMPIL